MNRFKTAFIGLALILSPLLSGLPAYAQQGDATLELRSSVTQSQNGQSFYVDVYVKNPSNQNIISVRNWLQYNPSDLEVTSIDRLDSPFTLAAPGENEASSSEKMIKMGYSNMKGGDTLAEAIVARVNFKVLTSQSKTTSLDFYDYQMSELGHTSVNIISQGFPVNILAQKPSSLSIPLNGGLAPAPAEVGGGDEVSVPVPVNTGHALARPLNLKVNTGPAYVHLKWDPSEEVNVAGYYLYYGKTSGLYTRRKTLGEVDSFILEDLRNGESYYFAITAYDLAGNESDYSNEVGVIVGEPLSSTHPFEDLANQMLAQVPVQAESGPALNWLLISALGLGVILGLGRIKKPESSF